MPLRLLREPRGGFQLLRTGGQGMADMRPGCSEENATEGLCEQAVDGSWRAGLGVTLLALLWS